MDSSSGSKKIKLLIVENSEKILQLISNHYSSAGKSETLEITHDIESAYSSLIKSRPDAIVLSADFPGISVHHFLERASQANPIPIIMLSSHSLKSKFITLQALEKGAVDFIVKPPSLIEEALSSMMSELERKLRYYTGSFSLMDTIEEQFPFTGVGKEILSGIDLIVITAQNNRLKYVSRIVSNLPENSPCIILIHELPLGFSKTFAGRLNEKSVMKVKEVENGETIERGKVIISLCDFHLRLNNESGKINLECFTGEKVHGQRPSADLLMFSAAEHLQDRVVAIKFGSGTDGINGLKLLRHSGCLTFCEEMKDSSSSANLYPGDINYYQPLPDLISSFFKIL